MPPLRLEKAGLLPAALGKADDKTFINHGTLCSCRIHIDLIE
jgi:hypothetical protein